MKFYSLLLLALTLSIVSCQKEATSEKEPEIVICFFGPYVPIRVVNALGDDLLDPSKLPGGIVDIKWGYPDGNMASARMNPATYFKNGQPEQFYFSAPLASAEKGLRVYFSVKSGDTDTLFIKTAANSSKPFGVTEVRFNGNKIDPKMLFGTTQYGLELVKD